MKFTRVISQYESSAFKIEARDRNYFIPNNLLKKKQPNTNVGFTTRKNVNVSIISVQSQSHDVEKWGLFKYKLSLNWNIYFWLMHCDFLLLTDWQLVLKHWIVENLQF